MICKHVGQIFLATPIFDEIKEIDESDCIELGIKLVEPELEQVMLASEKEGPLSFQDKLCLILAKKEGWTCVTNDIKEPQVERINRNKEVVILQRKSHFFNAV